MTPYNPFMSALAGPAQPSGSQLAQLAAIQPYLSGQPNPQTNAPVIPQYAGAASAQNLPAALMGRAGQQPAMAPGTAGTSLLNNPQLMGLLQQFMKNQNGTNGSFSGGGTPLAANINSGINTLLGGFNGGGFGAYGPTNASGQLIAGE
jgi:hypothetical protein